MTAYYNEVDPHAAAWLRNLIAEALIAPGVVDERDIRDVVPEELVRYTQLHFFAGIGLWSLALRSAGWPDDRPVITGSCPCQPFSTAGAGAGFADERHLWPAWFHILRVLRPGVVFGEQVASSSALEWIDLVQTDLEAEGYAFGSADTCAAGAGAPHIRNRLYWAADTDGDGRGEGWECFAEEGRHGIAGDGGAGFLVDARGARLEGHRGHGAGRGEPGRLEAVAGGSVAPAGPAGVMDDPSSARRRSEREDCHLANGDEETRRRQAESGRSGPDGCHEIGAGAVGNADSIGAGRRGGSVHQQEAGQGGRGRGDDALSSGRTFWSDIVWIPCRDGKARPTKPGLFPLAPRNPGDVGKLRAAGNGLCAPQAEQFIRAYLESRSMPQRDRLRS